MPDEQLPEETTQQSTGSTDGSLGDGTTSESSNGQPSSESDSEQHLNELSALYPLRSIGEGETRSSSTDGESATNGSELPTTVSGSPESTLSETSATTTTGSSTEGSLEAPTIDSASTGVHDGGDASEQPTVESITPTATIDPVTSDTGMDGGVHISSTESAPLDPAPAETGDNQTAQNVNIAQTEETSQASVHVPLQRPIHKRLKAAHYVIATALVILFGIGAVKMTGPIGQVVVPTPTPVVTPPSVSLAPVVLGVKCHAQFLSQTDAQAVLPDPNCTPGALNPNVTQANISQTICVPGYTGSIRPSVTYTNHLKLESIANYGYTDTNPKDFEEDHLVSLELGGSPDSPFNLWAEPHASPNEKDKAENYLHSQVCSGKMTLQEAQREIRTNWYQVYLSL